MKLGLWPMAVLALIAANCQSAQQQLSTVASSDMVTDEAAIRSLSGAFDSLLTASQEDPFLALLTADVAWMVPNQPALNGTEAVRGRLRWRFSASKLDLVTTIEELHVAEAWAYMKGSYRMRITPKSGGAPVDEEGKVINILRRGDDGRWRVSRHIWNADHPDQ